jgi:hypothetical protein
VIAVAVVVRLVSPTDPIGIEKYPLVIVTVPSFSSKRSVPPVAAA